MTKGTLSTKQWSVKIKRKQHPVQVQTFHVTVHPGDVTVLVCLLTILSPCASSPFCTAFNLKKASTPYATIAQKPNTWQIKPFQLVSNNLRLRVFLQQLRNTLPEDRWQPRTRRLNTSVSKGHKSQIRFSTKGFCRIFRPRGTNRKAAWNRWTRYRSTQRNWRRSLLSGTNVVRLPQCIWIPKTPTPENIGEGVRFMN